MDVRPLQNENRYRGIGMFTRSLLLALADVLQEQSDALAEGPGDRPSFVFYGEPGEPVPDALAARFPDARVIEVPAQRLAGIRYLWLVARPRALVPADRADVDVLLQCDPWGGIPAKVPTVAVFLDAIPLLFPYTAEKLPLGRKWVLQQIQRGNHAVRYRRSLAWYRRAAVVVAISESSRRDYLRLIESRPKNPVRVVLPAAVPAGSAERSDAALDRLGLRERPYLLYVGGVDPRKNVMRLLADLDELLPGHPDLRLVLVGQEFGLEEPLRLMGWPDFLQSHPEVAAAVQTPGYVADEELPSLYAHARAFVFPSRYEGFGLPILEAMAQDCPVICYDNSAIPEVAGDAALMVPDGAPMASEIARLLDDPALREELIARGRAQLANFSWHTAARDVLAAVNEAAATRGGAVRAR